MIYHIYWGTAGNAGLYLDEIYQALRSEGFDQEVFVSHYFPFDYGHKLFFRLTEMGHCKHNGKLRNAIRYMELIYALSAVYISIKRHKPTVVNYSFIGVFAPVLLFLKMVKKHTKCKLILTCHDVMPFENTHQTLTKQEKMRKEAFDLADYLLTHNQKAADELRNNFNIPSHKILCHRFPIMDMNKIYSHFSNSNNKEYDFVFLGHLRKEKGVEVLTEAWKKFHPRHKDACLCIAGNAPFGFETSEYEGMNIHFILNFLSDEQYYNLASSSKCIVLPYLRGTNSGVVSTLATLGVNVITSDLEMFKTNPLLDKDLMFECGNPDSLTSKMEKVVNGNYNKPAHMQMVDDYRAAFKQETIGIYKNVLQEVQ